MAVNKKTTASATSKDKSIESWIWDAACSIRGAKDAPKYKDFILPLIFTKRLCDVFDDELNPCGQETHAATVEFSGMKTVRERCCHQVTVNVME